MIKAAPSQIYNKYHLKVRQLHGDFAEATSLFPRGSCAEQQASSLPDLEQDRSDWRQELADSRLTFLGQTGLGKTTTLETLLILTTQVCCKFLQSNWFLVGRPDYMRTKSA